MAMAAAGGDPRLRRSAGAGRLAGALISAAFLLNYLASLNRNIVIPTKRSQIFFTYQDDQQDRLSEDQIEKMIKEAVQLKLLYYLALLNLGMVIPTKKYHPLDKFEQIEKTIGEAEPFADEDKKVQELTDAKNAFLSSCELDSPVACLFAGDSSDSEALFHELFHDGF